jgi:K+-transporting ATPase KdpF subunit
MCSTSLLQRSASSRCGESPSPATGPRRSTMFEYIVSGIVAVLLLVYLGWAMFRPERF